MNRVTTNPYSLVSIGEEAYYARNGGEEMIKYRRGLAAVVTLLGAVANQSASAGDAVTAEAISDYFSRPQHRKLVERLRQAGLRLRDEAETGEAPGALSGLTFVLTGTLQTLSRQAATELVEQHGGRVTGSVSRNTDYLLVGESPGNSKTRAADQLDVPQIDEEELRRLVSGFSVRTRSES